MLLRARAREELVVQTPISAINLFEHYVVTFEDTLHTLHTPSRLARLSRSLSLRERALPRYAKREVSLGVPGLATLTTGRKPAFLTSFWNISTLWGRGLTERGRR